jgi:LysR family hydrogen peroxide-inducible transcriptional activator
MELQQIRYFLAICEELNFTRAAKRYGVKQPSISIAIKRLERTLDGPLFIRENQGVRLTKRGQAMRPYLKKIDQLARDAKHKAAGMCIPVPRSLAREKWKALPQSARN